MIMVSARRRLDNANITFEINQNSIGGAHVLRNTA